MTATSSTGLRRTALFDAHVSAGGRMVDFAGWEMPVRYGNGTIAEHRAVRTSAGLFDVSHMGQIRVSGAGAIDTLQQLLSNDIAKLTADDQAQYTLLTNDHGGIEDDLIVYRIAADEYLLVVNASNAAHDLEWITARAGQATTVADESDQWAMFALQGPRALDLLADHVVDVRDVKPFHHRTVEWGGAELLVATTGYTGERGVELLVPPQAAVALWDALLRDERVSPCGLAARDTLRLEVCYPLHGNDITAQTSAVGAGLSWVCGWGTGFAGEDVLAAERASGPATRLRPIEFTGAGIPRAACAVVDGRTPIGTVSSGTISPMLEHGIALAWIRTDHAEPGTEVGIDVRGTVRPARVTKAPFYRRSED